METIRVRVPLRADLAGGTLDLWPLYLFHPGSRTVNVAISLHAECEISRVSDDSVIELFLTDQQYERRYGSLAELQADPHAALIARAVEHFKLTGIRVLTRTDAPRGSGLGGSSALAIALVRAISEFAGNPVEGDSLIELVRDLETRLLRVPAGIQDYYPPVYGGLMSLHLEPGKVVRHPLSLPIPELTRHFVLHYSAVQHFSGTNNWEIYKRQMDGDAAVNEGLGKIAASAAELEHALETHNMRAAGKALQKEWENRKALIQGISSPEIDAAIDAARVAGAWGGKVCGAGGGGCIVFLVPVKKKEAVRAALENVPGQTLNVVPVSYGLSVESVAAARAPLASTPRRSGKTLRNYEQLYSIGGQGEYRPQILAESRITYDEPRAGIRTTVAAAILAPVDLPSERVEWDQAITIRPEELQISAEPDAPGFEPARDPSEALAAAATEAEESLRQHFAARSRLTLFLNSSFNMWSEPNESLETFTRRCLERASRLLEDESERLESTFRRKLDQMREKSERDQRDLENQSTPEEKSQHKELNIAWGQALYNITSGRQIVPEGHPESVNQADYMERISLLQKQWEKEKEQKREELDKHARSIEEVNLTATEKNVEIVRYLILWTRSEVPQLAETH